MSVGLIAIQVEIMDLIEYLDYIVYHLSIDAFMSVVKHSFPRYGRTLSNFKVLSITESVSLPLSSQASIEKIFTTCNVLLCSVVTNSQK